MARAHRINSIRCSEIARSPIKLEENQNSIEEIEGVFTFLPRDMLVLIFSYLDDYTKIIVILINQSIKFHITKIILILINQSIN